MKDLKQILDTVEWYINHCTTTKVTPTRIYIINKSLKGEIDDKLREKIIKILQNHVGEGIVLNKIKEEITTIYVKKI